MKGLSSDIGFNLPGFKKAHQCVPIHLFADQDVVGLKTVFSVLKRPGRFDPSEWSEFPFVGLCDFSSPFDHSLKVGDLTPTQSGLKIGHPVIEPCFDKVRPSLGHHHAMIS